jgi:hypothetical protein
MSEDTTEDAAAGLDMDELASSLNGFDQIAVKKAFGQSVAELGQGDATMFMHALYFVHLRRRGTADAAARSESLSTSLKELTELFGGAGPKLDPTAEEDRDREWAEFVIGSGLAFTVNQFMELTINQRAQAIKAADRLARVR